MKEEKKIKLLKAFQMGMNCLIGSSSISVYDTTRDEARTTAHNLLLKVYTGDETLTGSDLKSSFAAAVTWFNESDEVVIGIYNQVEKSIQELINREMTYYVTHGYNKTPGQYRIEESISSIIQHYMVEYKERYVSNEKLEKYTLEGAV
tara:strand:- start:144 stop:587 length:444 start_codon:yes stop_codon:yes gene_type:complete